MSRISRPSPAILVAVIALVAALAGTAIADPGASTSAKAVTKAKAKKIANKQIDKRLPLGAADIAPAAVTASKLANITTREQTVNFQAGTFSEATANCQTGERLVSGGFHSTSTFAIPVQDHKQGEGWYVRAFNNGGNGTLTVEAYCLAP